MSYIPQTENDLKEMLNAIGVSSIDELFSRIPKRLDKKLNVPGPFSELEVSKRLKDMAKSNASADEYSYFIGGGSYFHYIPSVVPFLLNRSEFHTAYTPYQPEISQGTLQAIFEFQTLMTMLTGMEVSNASMYDGASSVAEAVLMSFRIKKKSKVIVSEALNPEYFRVLRTYLSGRGEIIEEVKFDRATGTTDIDELKKKIDDESSAFVVQYPNFFGCIENLEEIEKIVHEKGLLLIVAFSEPIAYGMLKPPGYFGADIVAGEGQSLGNPPAFGGPYLGILTARQKYIRTMPGRIVGETTDHNGRRAYVLTLSAREQHIRREKATSNICSNEGLCALAATIYLTAVGKQGFKEIAKQNHIKAEITKSSLLAIDGVTEAFSSPTFNEFVVNIEGKRPESLIEFLSKNRIIAGIPLGKYYKDFASSILITTTELNTVTEIQKLASLVEKYIKQ